MFGGRSKKRVPKPAAKSLLPEGLKPELQPIGEEIDRLHESAVYSAQGQFEQMKLWRSMNIVLGTPAAVLAAIAGGTGFSAGSHGSTTGVLALVSAGFGSALTALNPSRRVSSSQAAANAYLGIQTDARQLMTIKLSSMSRDEALDALSELTARRDEVMKTADPPSTYAYWRSKRNVGAGGQKYEVDT